MFFPAAVQTRHRPGDVWNIACRALSSTIIAHAPSSNTPCPIRVPVHHRSCPTSTADTSTTLTMLPLLWAPFPAHRLDVVVAHCRINQLHFPLAVSSVWQFGVGRGGQVAARRCGALTAETSKAVVRKELPRYTVRSTMCLAFIVCIRKGQGSGSSQFRLIEHRPLTSK